MTGEAWRENGRLFSHVSALTCAECVLGGRPASNPNSSRRENGLAESLGGLISARSSASLGGLIIRARSSAFVKVSLVCDDSSSSSLEEVEILSVGFVVTGASASCFAAAASALFLAT